MRIDAAATQPVFGGLYHQLMRFLGCVINSFGFLCEERPSHAKEYGIPSTPPTDRNRSVRKPRPI